MDRRMCFQLYHPIQKEKTFLPGRPTTHQVSSDTKGHQLRAQRFKGRSCWGRMGFDSCAQRRREGRSSKEAILYSTSTTRNQPLGGLRHRVFRWKLLPPPAVKTRRKNPSCHESHTEILEGLSSLLLPATTQNLGPEVSVTSPSKWSTWKSNTC